MHEARVKAIKWHSQPDGGDSLWEVYYDYTEKDVVSVCPMVWRAYAVDEMDMWVKFNQWFREDARGEPNNVIWIRV
jgi:hypothetical protein